MPQYRCYFVQQNGDSEGWRAFQSENDREAHDHALGLFVGYPRADRVELWADSRLALTYNRIAAQTPTALRRLCYLAIAAATKETDPKIKRIIASCAAALAQEAEALERRTNPESP